MAMPVARFIDGPWHDRSVTMFETPGVWKVPVARALPATAGEYELCDPPYDIHEYVLRASDMPVLGWPALYQYRGKITKEEAT